MKRFKVLTGEQGDFPMGLTAAGNRLYASVNCAGGTCSLLLFKRGEEEPCQVIPMDPRERRGDVWRLALGFDGALPRDMEYCFEADGRRMADPYGRAMRGWEDWGEPEHLKRLLRSPLRTGDFDWEDDALLRVPMEECVIYRLHVRGFTKHGSSGVRDRGTFKAVARKIPYMKELGVTTVELMPVIEFQEVAARGAGGPFAGEAVPGRLNYWGYADGFYFAPKAAYSARKSGDPVREFKGLVKELHENGMELVVELYFGGDESPAFVLDVVRCWVREFHLDGVHLVGNVSASMVGRDPYLSQVKIFAGWWDEADVRRGIFRKNVGFPSGDAGRAGGTAAAGASVAAGRVASVGGIVTAGAPAAAGGGASAGGTVTAGASVPASGSGARPRRLAEYNDGFMQDMRRFLKGDEGMVRAVMDRILRDPEEMGVVNYMACTNGFTLMDMVSYDRKHNEANGENNKDGSDHNYSWNCGEEGPTRKRKVLDLRRKQLRNALLLLFLSQGTPLLEAGDEFGHTRSGNNNAYCQDNAVSWLDWSRLRANRAVYEFAKQAIAFRAAHPVLHMAEPPKMADYLACGYPDVSFHGVNVWYPEFEDFRRQLAVMYCGLYARKPDGGPDDFLFVIYNMHWEPHEFSVPSLPKDRRWFVAMDTDQKEVNGFYAPGAEPELEDQKRCQAAGRSIVVLIGKTVEQETSGGRTGKKKK